MTAPLPRTDSWLPVASPRHGLVPLALGLALTAGFTPPARAAVDLTSMSLEQLLDVTIVGASKYEQRQAEVAAAVSVITRQEIKAYGWRTIDEALASLPGVHTTYDRQMTYFGARGFGLPGDFNTRLLVTINGNRVNEPTFDSGLFGHNFPLDIDLVERIEFIPGPGGAVYGQNAMFGVVNVITRSGGDVGGSELAASYQHPQALRTQRASWGQVLDNGADVLLSVSGEQSRGEDRHFDFGAYPAAGTAAGLDGERSRTHYARIARGAWSFEHAYVFRRKDDPTASFYSDPLVPGQHLEGSLALTQLQYQGTFAGDSLRLSARMFDGAMTFADHLSYQGGMTANSARSHWSGAELRLLSTAVLDHKLLAGLEGQDTSRSDQNVPNLLAPGTNLLIQSPGYRLGLYAQDEWRMADALTATLGLRLDRNNTTGTSTSPRAALIWQATAATTAKVLLGRAERAPNTHERDYDDAVTEVANPGLRGERIDTLEVVADHRVGRDLTLRGSIYQWKMHDLITLVTVDDSAAIPLTQFQSGAWVQARGMELSADKTYPSGARLRGSVSVQDAAYADGSELINSPKVLVKFNLSLPLPLAGLLAGYELRYDSPRLSLDGSRLGGYALSNLTLSTESLARGLALSVGFYNLFDKRYAQPGADSNWQNALEQDGRSVRLSMRLAF